LKKICLLGTNLGATNLGLLALADAALKLTAERWPDSATTVHGFGTAANEDHVGRYFDKPSGQIELWFGKGVHKSANVLNVFFFTVLSRLVPRSAAAWIRARHPVIRQIRAFDIVLDITGGDSFTDMYGYWRFIRGSLYKACFALNDRRVVYLPQTYGPFKHRTAIRIAAHLLGSAYLVTARDVRSAEAARKLITEVKADDAKIVTAADLAFVLDAARFESEVLDAISGQKKEGQAIIGINISGLLFNRTKQETASMFGITKLSYRTLMTEIVHYFLGLERTVVVLIPHVLAPREHFESDPRACETLLAELGNHEGRLLYEKRSLDHRTAKYLIGHCSFFLGSRMHSCIAALSQCIPAIGLAYSDKFLGVFQSVGVGNCVVDLREVDHLNALRATRALWEARASQAAELARRVPQVQEVVRTVLKHAG
jgi:polysaccharide pyruvyl transferase WcaK-like protein